VVFGVQLDRARDAPTRFAFATLIGSDRLWIGLVIGLPLAFFLLTPVHSVFIAEQAQYHAVYGVDTRRHSGDSEHFCRTATCELVSVHRL
jgi:hypothetical protein